VGVTPRSTEKAAGERAEEAAPPPAPAPAVPSARRSGITKKTTAK
jgi:hypothetical protein